MQPKRSPKDLTDDELVAELKALVGKMNQVSSQALADARAGKYVDPVALDFLRGDIDDDELDELEELNAKRLD
jgi:hypothetical protein